jgi:thioredoxin-related protein
MPREFLHSATRSLNTLEKSKVFMHSKNELTLWDQMKTSLKKEEEMFHEVLKNELTICRSNTW